MITAIWQTSGEYAITTSSLMQLAYYLGASLAMTLAPLFLVALVVGFFSTFLQIGWLFTTQPLHPRSGQTRSDQGHGPVHLQTLPG